MCITEVCTAVWEAIIGNPNIQYLIPQYVIPDCMGTSIAVSLPL